MVEFNFLNIFLFAMFSLNLVVLSFYDLKYKAVPDYLLLLSLVLSFLVTKYDFYYALENAIICVGAIVLLNFIVTFYIQNIKSRIFKDDRFKTQTALGEGDMPIIASFGAILGLELTIFTVFLSALIAIIHWVYIRFVQKEHEIPFIPSLCIGFFLEFVFNLSTFFKDFY